MARRWAFIRIIFGRGELRPPSRKKGGDAMRDLVIAAIRTGVVTLATALVSALAGFDITVDLDALTLVLTGVAVGVVNLAFNWLQSKFPWLGTVLSLGLSRTGSTPSYN